MNLAEKYRPESFEQVLGQDKAVNRIRRLMDRSQFTGDAFWLSGPSGSGKTSLAWIMAKSKCADFDIFHCNGDRCSVDEINRMAATFQLASWGESGWKALIVDEAHAATPRAVQALLTFLEPLHPRRLVIFTSTERLQGDLFGKFTNPLASRCKVFHLECSDVTRDIFAMRALEIARAEGLDGKPLSAYRQLCQKADGNMRSMLQMIDSGEMME